MPIYNTWLGEQFQIIEQLLTFISINIRIYRSKIYDIYLGFGLGKYKYTLER